MSYLLNIMKKHELQSILQTLESHRHKGLGVYSISRQTDIKPSKLRQYFKANQNYFVQLTESRRYTINRFGEGKGNITKILEHFDTGLMKKNRDEFFYYFAISLSFLTILININA